MIGFDCYIYCEIPESVRQYDYRIMCEIYYSSTKSGNPAVVGRSDDRIESTSTIKGQG